MLVTTTISVIAILLAYISQFKTKAKYFDYGFILLTITAAIQYDYGTDYMSYYELWERYNSLDIKLFISDFFNQIDWTEPGWMLLNAIFGFNNGFLFLVALVSVIENYIYYRFIKEYVPAKWRWFSVLLYVGMDNLYLLNFSMLRQGLTVALFVAAIMLINKKKLLWAVTVLVVSLTIHLSSAICIPFIVLYFIPFQKTKFLSKILMLLTFVIFVFKNVVTSAINFIFIFGDLGKYAGYGGDTLQGIGFGYILAHIPNIVILYVLYKGIILETKEQKIIALLAFCDMLITPLQFYGADMAGRLGIFFMAFRVAAIPMLYGLIKRRMFRFTLIFLTVVSTLIVYFQFFQHYSGGYSEGYRTFFSVL